RNLILFFDCFFFKIFIASQVSAPYLCGLIFQQKSMIAITLPDGSIKKFEAGVTPMDVAKSISEGLARNVISAAFNGTTIETTTPLTQDGNLILFTWNDDEGKKAFWHSTSHVMAQALEELYPGIKLTIGPAIDNGFYYDIDFGDHAFSDKELKRVEDKM